MLPEDDLMSWGWRVPFPVKHRAAVRRDVYPLKDRRDAGVSGESEAAAERAENGRAEVSCSHRAQTSP